MKKLVILSATLFLMVAFNAILEKVYSHLRVRDGLQQSAQQPVEAVQQIIQSNSTPPPPVVEHAATSSTGSGLVVVRFQPVPASPVSGSK